MSDVEVRPVAVVADLSQITLDTLFGGDAKPTTYSENGVCRKRLKGVIKNGCKSCRGMCVTSITAQSLERTCRSLWRLQKEAQDAILWSLGGGVRHHSTTLKPADRDRQAGPRTDVLIIGQQAPKC